MATDMPQGGETTGKIKWFDPAKGFGFIVPDDGGADVLLHANVLRNFGQSSVADGSLIRFVLQETPRGLQAQEVLEIDVPDTAGLQSLSDLADLSDTDIASVPLEPARVKWFDKGKGFGFANIFGLSDDIFVHIEVLRKSGLSDLQPGEAICIRVIDGQRGRMATAVEPWESANS